MHTRTRDRARGCRENIPIMHCTLYLATTCFSFHLHLAPNRLPRTLSTLASTANEIPADYTFTSSSFSVACCTATVVASAAAGAFRLAPFSAFPLAFWDVLSLGNSLM